MTEPAGYLRVLLSFMEDVVQLPLFRKSAALTTFAIVIYKYNLLLYLSSVSGRSQFALFHTYLSSRHA